MATTNTKKTLEEGFTSQPLATTAEDVNGQDSRTRLWQSLGYTYGNQLKQSDKSYQKAISQNDNAMLARGMQRSSYGAQVRANLMNQQIEAQNDIASAHIADYQNRIGQLEQQELENERWQQEFDANRADAEWSQAFQEKQAEIQQEQWREQFDYSKKSDDQKLAYNYLVSMISAGKTPSADLIARAGLSSADVKAMTNTAKKSGSAGTVTWRQAADAAAKKAGYSGRNDPAYLASLQNPSGNGNNNTKNSLDIVNNYGNGNGTKNWLTGAAVNYEKKRQGVTPTGQDKVNK